MIALQQDSAMQYNTQYKTIERNKQFELNYNLVKLNYRIKAK